MVNNRQIETLMLIDDDELDHILCKRVISRSGLVKNLVRFYYAEEALQYLKDESTPNVDIILLDINMPRMDGFDFLRVASCELSEAVVVMLTTSVSPMDKERALSYDIVKRYMNKPMSPEYLEEIMGLV